MIKKSVFEDELIAGMHKELVKNASSKDVDSVESAVDYLNSAITIFEDAGMVTHANQVIQILSKIAEQSFDENNAKSQDNLTSERMVANLKDHGTVFNMADDNASDDLLNLEIGNEDLLVSEEDSDSDLEDFEDEI